MERNAHDVDPLALHVSHSGAKERCSSCELLNILGKPKYGQKRCRDCIEKENKRKMQVGRRTRQAATGTSRDTHNTPHMCSHRSVVLHLVCIR